MEQALSKIGEQGLAGALLVLCVLAIVYINKKKEDVSDARLADTREALLVMAKNNEVMSSFKDAVSGLTASLAALTTTVQTMRSDSKSALELTRTRDDRVERMIENNGKVLQELGSSFESIERDINRFAGSPNQGGR